MILDIYRQYLNQTLSDNVEVEEGIWISQVSNLSLQEYIQARSTYCSLYHRNNCKNCESMIKAAHIVLQNGICSLSTVFRAAFRHVTYIAQQARCQLLQMPLAAIHMGTPSSGHCTIQITEYISGLNYSNFTKSLRQVFQKSVSVPSNPSISKEEFQQLLAFAHSYRERETLTYAVCKASGLTATGARRMYGLDNIAERMAQVEESFREAQTIRENIEELAAIQVKAMLESEGHVTLDNSSSESESSNSESESKNCHTDQLNQHPTILNTEVKELLISNNFNWFSVLDNLSEKYGASIEDELEHYYTDAMDSPFTESEKSLLEQSHKAYLASIEEQKQAIRQADCLNGMIVTDSESDDPDDYLPCNVSNQSTQKLVAKKTKSIYRRARYLKAKQIAERNFLSRKTSRKVRGILREYPDIGKQMEIFVQERNIGADA